MHRYAIFTTIIGFYVSQDTVCICKMLCAKRDTVNACMVSVLFHVLYSYITTLNKFERSFCAGPGKEIYTVGGSGAKGIDGSEEKLYCQVKREALDLYLICVHGTLLFCSFVCALSVCLSVCLCTCVFVCCPSVHPSVRSQLSAKRPCSLMTPPSSLGWRKMKTMSSTATATIWEHLGQWGTPEVRWSGSGGGGGEKGSDQLEVRTL